MTDPKTPDERDLAIASDLPDRLSDLATDLALVKRAAAVG